MVRSVRASSSTTSSEYDMFSSVHQFFFFRLRRGASQMPHRQVEAHGRAAVGNALHFHLAVVAAHIGLADAQAESGSLAALGGEEGLEDARQDVGGNAAAGVGDADLDAVVELHLVGAHGDGAA